MLSWLFAAMPFVSFWRPGLVTDLQPPIPVFGLLVNGCDLLLRSSRHPSRE